MKRKFFWMITYFKESGKYYTNAVVEWEIRTLSDECSQPYYHDAVAKLRGLRNSGNTLPGLCGDCWDGPILIEQAKPRPDLETEPNIRSVDDFVSDGVPHLILP